MASACIIVATIALACRNSWSQPTWSCSWLDVQTHSLCHSNNGIYGDGDACNNDPDECDEGCCGYVFRITNAWLGNTIQRIDICAEEDCESNPANIAPCETRSNIPTHICDVCPIKDPNLMNFWVEDPACSRVYTTLLGTPDFLGDSTVGCDSACRTSCVHLIDNTGQGIFYKQKIAWPVAFTGCRTEKAHCLTICVTIEDASHTRRQECCHVTIPPCNAQAYPTGYVPCTDTSASARYRTGNALSTSRAAISEEQDRVQRITSLSAKYDGTDLSFVAAVTNPVDAIVEIVNGAGNTTYRTFSHVVDGRNTVDVSGAALAAGVYSVVLRGRAFGVTLPLVIVQ